MTDLSSTFNQFFAVAVNGRTMSIPLEEIEIDEAWNARTGDWKADLEALEASLQPDGPWGSIVQDIPVVVRPNEYGPGGKPYFLVSGFSRCECIRRICIRIGDPNPKVLAVIRVLDEGESLAMNLRENQARNPLKEADVAKQLHKLYYWYAENKGIWLQTDELGALVGTNAVVAARMLEVMRKGSDDLIRLWQNSRVKINLIDLVGVVRKYEKGEQKRAFLILTAYLEKTVGHTGRLGQLAKRAKQIGSILGILESDGKITINDRNFRNYVGTLLGYAVEKTSYKSMVLAKYIEDSYKRAVGYQPSAISPEENKDEGSLPSLSSSSSHPACKTSP